MSVHLVGVYSPDEETDYGSLIMETLPRVGEHLTMYDRDRKIHALRVVQVYHSYLHAQERLRSDPMDEHAEVNIAIYVVPREGE